MDTTPDHAGWFRDARTIIAIVEVTPGLPLPVISATSACFYLTVIPHAADTRAAVARAVALLADSADLTFELRTALAGDDTERYILEAFMPSGLAVDIVARPEHMAVAA